MLWTCYISSVRLC